MKLLQNSVFICIIELPDDNRAKFGRTLLLLTSTAGMLHHARSVETKLFRDGFGTEVDKLRRGE